MREATLTLVHFTAKMLRASATAWSQPVTLATADVWEAELDLGCGRVIRVPGFYRTQESATRSAEAFAQVVLGRPIR